MIKQPPRSPEFNALDFGIFNSLQKKVYIACPRSIGELITCVKNAFDNLHRDKIHDVFLSVQASMRDCLKVNGDNIEPLYHMGKPCLRCGGMLPVVLTVDY